MQNILFYANKNQSPRANDVSFFFNDFQLNRSKMSRCHMTNTCLAIAPLNSLFVCICVNLLTVKIYWIFVSK